MHDPEHGKVPPGTHAVVVMAKAPVSGAVKSRLVPPLTEDEAAALNRCFIRDVCASIEAAAAIVAADRNARATDPDANSAAGNADIACANARGANARKRTPRVVGMIAYTPAGAQSAFDGLVPPSFKFIEQRGEGLTARLTNVAADLFAEGYASVSLMNSDSPTIPPAFIAAAVTHLARANGDRPARAAGRLARPGDRSSQLIDRPARDDVPAAHADDGGVHPGDRLAIIGADDGGYCLIGLNRPHPRVFAEISWSTNEVLAQTLQRAAELRLVVLRTPSWYDVDEVVSLRRLIGELWGESSFGPSGNLSGNVNFSEKPDSTPISYQFPESAALGQAKQSTQKSKNKTLQNKPNFFIAPATRDWLAVALPAGLADRLGLPLPARFARPPRHATRSRDK